MSKVSDFWKNNTTAGGQIAWPEDPAGRDALARRAFGAAIVEAIDYWLARADELIDNRLPPAEPWRVASEDPAYRPTFAGLDEAQRDVVRKLVRDTALGVVFSSLTNLDQGAGRFDISLVDEGIGVSSASGRVPASRESLHDGLYDWVWELSAYRNALMSRTPTGRGGTTDRFVVSGSQRREA